jgi:hypothetical protein
MGLHFNSEFIGSVPLAKPANELPTLYEAYLAVAPSELDREFLAQSTAAQRHMYWSSPINIMRQQRSTMLGAEIRMLAATHYGLIGAGSVDEIIAILSVCTFPTKD